MSPIYSDTKRPIDFTDVEVAHKVWLSLSGGDSVAVALILQKAIDGFKLSSMSYSSLFALFDPSIFKYEGERDAVMNQLKWFIDSDSSGEHVGSSRVESVNTAATADNLPVLVEPNTVTELVSQSMVVSHDNKSVEIVSELNDVILEETCADDSMVEVGQDSISETLIGAPTAGEPHIQHDVQSPEPFQAINNVKMPTAIPIKAGYPPTNINDDTMNIHALLSR